MADRSLALCGRLADGLIVPNLCPPAYTARAVAIVRESAAVAGREAFDIVQYLPCAARPDAAEAQGDCKRGCRRNAESAVADRPRLARAARKRSSG